ncbi:MAG: Smr/MutS family protein, partial [Candidatus Omnitrophica bacterium]|nr:Smr/MutS family protein [Candidatus Omnitrophota bacterium]
ESEIAFKRVQQRFPKSGLTPEKEVISEKPMVKGFTPSARYEINLIGKKVEEMESELVKYLDEAALTGYDEIRVIHGFGTGALREGVRRVLSNHPVVKSFRPGEEGEGGGGATVVRFKR